MAPSPPPQFLWKKKTHTTRWMVERVLHLRLCFVVELIQRVKNYVFWWEMAKVKMETTTVRMRIATVSVNFEMVNSFCEDDLRLQAKDCYSSSLRMELSRHSSDSKMDLSPSSSSWTRASLLKDLSFSPLHHFISSPHPPLIISLYSGDFCHSQ